VIDLKIYDIDARLDELLNGSIDEETGEIITDFDEIEKLQMEREAIREGIACHIIGDRAEILALQMQEQKLKERRQRLERHVAKTEDFLERISNGVGLQSDRVSVVFRQSAGKVVVLDEAKLREWAKANRDDLLTYKEPEIKKSAVKAAIQGGEDIPYACIDKTPTMSVR
jgi:hypothetical protein